MDSPQISVNELAMACAQSASAEEWREFLRRTTPLASLVAVRVSRMWMIAPTAVLIDDIVQEVFLKFCDQERRILRDFEPRGEDSFLGLFRIVATSVANDYFRRMRSTKRGGKVVTSALVPENTGSHPDRKPETEQVHRTILVAQLDRRMRSAGGAVSARDRTLFWLYYEQGFTAEEISTLPSIGLTAKGVESALRRIVLWLRAEVASSETTGIPPEYQNSSQLSKGALPANPFNRD